MKSALFIVLLCCLQHVSFSQDYRNHFQLSIGYPHKAMKSNIKNCPMLTVMYERRISKLGIGFFGALGEFQGYEYYEPIKGAGVILDATGTLGALGLRANYYVIERERFDLYAGAMAYYLQAIPGNLYTQRTPYPNGLYEVSEKASNSNGFKVGAQVGGHFWFRERFGLWAEINYGVALVNVGVALRK